MHDPEGLEELVEVDAAVLVEVDAARQVVDDAVLHRHSQVRAEELPGLAELLDGDETCGGGVGGVEAETAQGNDHMTIRGGSLRLVVHTPVMLK